ncbi:MAG: helix-turn-helix domain-containing protein [Prevotella sp.]|jgi:AraC family transcriptional activator of pobA
METLEDWANKAGDTMSVNNSMALRIVYSDDDIIILDSIKQMVDSALVRMKMNGIMICLEGTAQVDINGKQTTIHKSQIIMFPPNTRFENMLFSVDFQCKVLLITDQIIRQFLRPYLQRWNEMMYTNSIQPIDLSEMDLQFISRTYEIVQFCLQDDSNNFRDEIIQRFIQGGLLGLIGKFSKESSDAKLPRKTQGSDIFPRFLDLLQNERSNFRTVADYASRLCITPKYLTVICKQHSGKTAQQWIKEYKLADIEYYLKATDKSVKEVSNILNFPNPSFFCKYVREHLGTSPQEYRNKNRSNIATQIGE